MNPLQFENFLGIILTIALAILLTWTGVSLYQEYSSPTYNISKQAWECTKTKFVTHIQLIGKVWIPVTTETCVQYTEKE